VSARVKAAMPVVDCRRCPAMPLETLGALWTLIFAMVVRPKLCPTSLNGGMEVCPSCTLQMMLLLPGWILITYARRSRRRSRDSET